MSVISGICQECQEGKHAECLNFTGRSGLKLCDCWHGEYFVEATVADELEEALTFLEFIVGGHCTLSVETRARQEAMALLLKHGRLSPYEPSYVSRGENDDDTDRA